MPEPPVSPIPDQTLASLAEASKNVNLRLDREQQDRHLMAKLANDRAIHENKLALEREKDLGIQKRYEQARADEMQKKKLDDQYQNDLNAWQDEKDKQNKEYEKLVLEHNAKLERLEKERDDLIKQNDLEGAREKNELITAEELEKDWKQKYLTRQKKVSANLQNTQKVIVTKIGEIARKFEEGLTAWKAQHAGAAADWTAEMLRDPVAFFKGEFAAQLGYDFSELDQLTPEAAANNKAILASIGSAQLEDMIDALYSHSKLVEQTGQEGTLTLDDLFGDTPGAWTTDRQGNKIGEDEALDNMKEHLKAGFQAAMKEKGAKAAFNNWIASLPEDNAYRTVLSQMIHSGATNLQQLFEGLSARPSVLEEAGLDPEGESEQVEAFKTQMQDISTNFSKGIGIINDSNLKIFGAKGQFDSALKSDIASGLIEIVAQHDILSTEIGIEQFINDYETGNMSTNLMQNLETSIKDQLASWINVLPEPEMRAEAEQFIAERITNVSGGNMVDHFMKPLIKTLKLKGKAISHRNNMEKERADYLEWKKLSGPRLQSQIDPIEQQLIDLGADAPIAPLAPPRPQREIY